MQLVEVKAGIYAVDRPEHNSNLGMVRTPDGVVLIDTAQNEDEMLDVLRKAGLAPDDVCLLIPAAKQLPDLAGAGSPVWLSIAYLGVFGTGLGFVWFYDGVRDIGPTRAGIFINLVPAWAILLGTLFLHEQILPVTLLGGLFIIAGVTITNLSNHREN